MVYIALPSLVGLAFEGRPSINLLASTAHSMQNMILLHSHRIQQALPEQSSSKYLSVLASAPELESAQGALLKALAFVVFCVLPANHTGRSGTAAQVTHRHAMDAGVVRQSMLVPQHAACGMGLVCFVACLPGGAAVE